MKFKLILILVFIFIAASCKNENKETNSISEPSKSSTKTLVSDSIKSDSAIVKTSPNNLAENKKLLLDFYVKNDKKPQFFIINNQKDTTIVCAEKTRIIIRANSFIVLKTGNEAAGKITLSVKEYYSISDILLGRLSTVSNGKILETGGMLDINAVSGQEKCDLKKGKSIEIAFPRKAEKEGMQLFTGSRIKDQVNWNIDKNSIDLDEIFTNTNVDEKPIYPGGNEKMYKFIGKNFRTPEDYTNGKVYVSFVIDKDGNVTDIKISKSLNKQVDAEAIRVIKMLGRFTPAKVNGTPVNCMYNLPITIHSDEESDAARFPGTSANNTVYNSKYIEKSAEEIQTSKISYNLFSSTKLGLINCDRFWNYPDFMKINYAVNLGSETGVSTSIIFHRFKSVMTLYSSSNKVVFSEVIAKEKITIFAVKYLDDKLFFAAKETIINSKSQPDLEFYPVTQEDLKAEMQKLNQFN